MEKPQNTAAPACGLSDSNAGLGRQLHVAISPLTDRIFAGHVLKDGQTWGANKRDVTGEACAAVAQHTLAKGGSIVVTANGNPLYEITVVEVPPNVKLSSRPPTEPKQEQ